MGSHNNGKQPMKSPPENNKNRRPPQDCARCGSSITKFCYYNNGSPSQPRYFCKTCRRYWTQGGALRRVPVGGYYRNGNMKHLTKDSTSGASYFIGECSRSQKQLPPPPPPVTPPPSPQPTTPPPSPQPSLQPFTPLLSESPYMSWSFATPFSYGGTLPSWSENMILQANVSGSASSETSSAESSLEQLDDEDEDEDNLLVYGAFPPSP